MVEVFNPKALGGESFVAKFFRYDNTTFITKAIAADTDWQIKIIPTKHQDIVSYLKLPEAELKKIKNQQPERLDAGIVKVNMDTVPPSIVFILSSSYYSIPTEFSHEIARKKTVEIEAPKFPDYNVSS